MPGRPLRSAATSAPGSMRPARLVLTSRASASSAPGPRASTMPRVAGTSRMCSESTSHSAKKPSFLAAASRPSARARASDAVAPRRAPASRTRRRSRPRPSRCGRSHRGRASCRAAVADARLPPPGLQRRHLLRDLSHRREHQSPGQLRGRVGGRARVQVRGDDDAEPRARLDVDVRVDAALADQAQAGQPLEQRRADLRALADQHERLEAPQPLGEASASCTWSVQTVTSCPASFSKHGSVRSVSNQSSRMATFIAASPTLVDHQ